MYFCRRTSGRSVRISVAFRLRGYTEFCIQPVPLFFRPRVIWMVLREALAMAIAGLSIGLSAAFAASRVVESFLFQMKPADPLALTLAASILLAATLLAGCVPAWRASKVDPWTSLRDE